MKFVVKRCVRDFNEVFKNEVARFATEAEAVAFVDAADEFCMFGVEWHEVEEE